MVCPCGVGGVALFALPAAFAKFNALPAPKKKAAALFLVPLVMALAAWCTPWRRTSQHTVAPQPCSRRAASRCRYLKPGCASCFSECPQTRNMGLGFAALWLLAIKNALASGSSQLCEKAQGKKLGVPKDKLEVAKAA